MNQTQETQDPKLPFWKFLVGFVLLEVAIVALSALGSGCSTVDPDAVYEIYTNIVVRIPDSSAYGAEKGEASSGSAGGSASSTATDGKDNGAGQGEKPASSSSSVALNWKYGGFNGGKAIEDPNCQIKSLSMSSKGVTFKFSGSWWDATHDNPTMRCCVFYKDGSGKWVGGFWEWGSPDRSYRAFTNIDDGYKGWDAKAFHAAKEYAFCICSKDGKKRSNIVYAGGVK
jgi:hypothetical protein